MKNGKRKVIAQIAGPGLVLAALLVMVLSNACIGRAQAGTASPAVTPAMPAEAVSHTPAPLAAKPPAKGQHEGIKVHGHWTIEVRNPDGKLVSHTEFENALVQPSGAKILATLLAGVGVPGGYRVTVGDSTGFIGPCAPLSAVDPSYTACYLVGSLISPMPATFGDNFLGCGGAQPEWPVPVTAAGPCFPLSISLASAGLNFNGTAVSASTTAPITDVYLVLLPCGFQTGVSSGSPSSCATDQANQQGVAQNLTHATLSTPVQITAVGQLISVNVQLSFQ